MQDGLAELTKKKVLAQFSKILERIDLATRHIETLPDLPENTAIRIYQTDGQIWIDMPYDKKMFAKYRRMMGHDWKRISRSLGDNGRGYRNFRYRHRESNQSLILSLETYRDGATCHLVRVGEKTEPIYQIVCD